MTEENIKLVNNITYSFFENFYCFTLFFVIEYKTQFESYSKKGYINHLFKEIKEYFSTSQNFYYNLRDFEDLQKIKTEQIDCIINDKEKEDKNKLYQIVIILMVYPDIILSGFNFFFDCKEIVEEFYNLLLELFIYTYRYFRDKFYDFLLEHLLNKIMFNKYLKNKIEEKNKFMFKLLNSLDLINSNRIRINENLLGIFINYLKQYLTFPNANKKDPYITQTLHIILYNASKLELKNRKNIFELIKCFIGNKLIDCLKWIFTFEYNDNQIFSYIYYESIPLSIDLLLSYFEEGIPLIMNTNNYSKFKNLEKKKMIILWILRIIILIMNIKFMTKIIL